MEDVLRARRKDASRQRWQHPRTAAHGDTAEEVPFNIVSNIDETPKATRERAKELEDDEKTVADTRTEVVQARQEYHGFKRKKRNILNGVANGIAAGTTTAITTAGKFYGLDLSPEINPVTRR